MTKLQSKFRRSLSWAITALALLAWVPGSASALDAGYAASVGTPAVYAPVTVGTESVTPHTFPVTANGYSYTAYEALATASVNTSGYSSVDFTTIANSGPIRWLLENSYPQKSISEIQSATGISGLSESDAVAATQIRLMQLGSAIGGGISDANVNSLVSYYQSRSASMPAPAISVDTTKAVYTNDGFVGPFRVSANETAHLTGSVDISLAQSGYTLYDSAKAYIISTVAVNTNFYVKLPSNLNSGTITINAGAQARVLDAAAFRSGNDLLVGGRMADTRLTVSADGTWERDGRGPVGPAKDMYIRKWVSHINGVATNQTGNESAFTEYTVKRGDKVTYAIRLTNRADLSLRAARVLDEIPAGMSYYDSDNVGNGWTRNGDKLYMDSNNLLAIGNSVTYSLTLRVNDNAAYSKIVNTAWVNDLRCAQNTPYTCVLDNAKIAIFVDGQGSGNYDYDLALQKWVLKVNDSLTNQSGTEVNPVIVSVRRGDKVTFGIRVINQGKKAAKPTRIMDTLPQGLTFTASDNNIGWYLASNGRLYLDPSGPVLSSGGQYTYELVLRVSDSAAFANISNVARIVSMSDEYGNSVADADSYLEDELNSRTPIKDNCITENARTGGDDDSYDIAVIYVTDGSSVPSTSDLRVTKYVHSVSGSATGLNGGESSPTVYTVAKNSTITWGIRLYNAGSTTLRPTNIIDTMPSGLEFLTGNTSNSGWTVLDNNRVSYALSVVLEPGQSTTVYVTSKILSNVGVQLTNAVDVTCDSKTVSANATINVKNFENMVATGESVSTLLPVFIGGGLLLTGGLTLTLTRKKKIRK